MGYMVMVMDYMDVMITVPPQHEYHSAHPLLPSSSSAYSVSLLLVAHCSVDMIFTVLFHSSVMKSQSGLGSQVPLTEVSGSQQWVCGTCLF